MQKHHLCQFFFLIFHLNTFKAKILYIYYFPSSGCQFEKVFRKEQRGGWARTRRRRRWDRGLLPPACCDPAPRAETA